MVNKIEIIEKNSAIELARAVMLKLNHYDYKYEYHVKDVKYQSYFNPVANLPMYSALIVMEEQDNYSEY